ncbi:MAG: hypothetical protein RIQ81_2082 [Pseudomonadota bacterium]|jgi:hypothetical protein
MLADIAMGIAVACIVIGTVGFLWNFSLGTANRWRKRSASLINAVERFVPPVSEDRKLYERALVLVRENRIVDGAKVLEELGLNREAAAVLERGGMVHEAAAVFLRRKRYHRAAEVYARHRMWEQAGNSYLLAASAMQERSAKSTRTAVATDSAGVKQMNNAASPRP